jgi:hypothetical protein
MKPSRSFYARLADAVNPFYVALVSLVAVSALPVPSGWAAALWIALMIAGTYALRHRSRERASELSRATLMSPRGRRPIDHGGE